MSIADIQNSMALPASAQLKLRPTGVPARRTRINIQPYQQPGSNTDITGSQLIQFYIPSRRGTMYDPRTMYLRGTITGVKATAATQRLLNRNAFSMINRLQVYGQDSTLLEDIQNYNDLAHTLLDVQMSREDKLALSTMYAESDSSVTATYTGSIAAASIQLTGRTAAGAAPAYADEAALLAAFNAGGRIGRVGPTAAGVADADVAIAVNPATTTLIDNGVVFADENASIDFCIPLLSAFGLLADTLVPVGWLGSDLRFDFYTESPNVAFRSHDGAYANAQAVNSYQLKDLELVMDQITFDGESLSMVSEFAPPSGPLYLHASTYRTYTNTLAGGAGGANGYTTIMVPHPSLSVKQVLCVAHKATTNGYDSFARVLPFGSADPQISLSIGGKKYPQKPISKVSELFAELQKSQHSFNQLIMNGSISRTEYTKYNANLTDVATSLTCKPVIGFDTETWDKKGSTIINGQNWTGLNVFLQGQVYNDAAGAQLANALNINTFVNFDVIYVIQDGVLSLRF